MDYKQLTPLPNDDILLTVAQYSLFFIIVSTVQCHVGTIHSDYFQRITALQLFFLATLFRIVTTIALKIVVAIVSCNTV